MSASFEARSAPRSYPTNVFLEVHPQTGTYLKITDRCRCAINAERLADGRARAGHWAIVFRRNAFLMVVPDANLFSMRRVLRELLAPVCGWLRAI